MQKIFFLLFCFFAVFFSSAQQSLLPAQFEKKMQSGNVQLLDVRTIKEYQTGSLETALQADWLNSKEFSDRTGYLDKNKPLLVFCASGMRSAEAAKWLQQQGFKDVSNMEGGMIAWRKSGKPVAVREEGTKSLFTLDSYQAKIKSSSLVLVDVGAPWCPPCRKMEPVIRQLLNETPKLLLLQVEAGIDIDIMNAEKVEGIPTFIVYKNGRETWRKQGLVTIEELRKQVGK
ncbi:rhodanese-like domain-containing protein [Sediminibacterium soli]|uniref:rhodanese-like domain-containing protein n=1 Tax=Sediminibacterium soli TaxID=2698829 RepID=UPI001379FFBF|nr:rhodanese-like domain-containing protein [Sediminibacterium soli]NCI47147.1 hypothetical protein [Sediminibacterium soli]